MEVNPITVNCNKAQYWSNNNRWICILPTWWEFLGLNLSKGTFIADTRGKWHRARDKQWKECISEVYPWCSADVFHNRTSSRNTRCWEYLCFENGSNPRKSRSHLGWNANTDTHSEVLIIWNKLDILSLLFEHCDLFLDWGPQISAGLRLVEIGWNSSYVHMSRLSLFPDELSWMHLVDIDRGLFA